MDDESTTKTSRLKSRTVTIIGNDYVEVSYIVLTLTCSHLKSICQKKRNERGTNFGNFLLLIITWEEMVVVTNNPLRKCFKRFYCEKIYFEHTDNSVSFKIKY